MPTACGRPHHLLRRCARVHPVRRKRPTFPVLDALPLDVWSLVLAHLTFADCLRLSKACRAGAAGTRERRADVRLLRSDSVTSTCLWHKPAHVGRDRIRCVYDSEARLLHALDRLWTCRASLDQVVRFHVEVRPAQLHWYTWRTMGAVLRALPACRRLLLIRRDSDDADVEPMHVVDPERVNLVAGFRALPLLEMAQLVGVGVPGAHLEALAHPHPNLTTLAFDHNPIGDAGFAHLLRAMRGDALPALRRLSLVEVGLTAAGTRACAGEQGGAARAHALEQLCVKGNALGDEGFAHVVAWMALDLLLLRGLDVSCCDLTNVAVEHLAAARPVLVAAELGRLEMHENESIDDVGVLALGQSVLDGRLPVLRDVHFAMTDVSHEAMDYLHRCLQDNWKRVAFFRHHRPTALKATDARWTGADVDLALRALGEYAEETLSSLCLTNNDLGDEGVLSVMRSVRSATGCLTHLCLLNLRRNGIADDAVWHLRGALAEGRLAELQKLVLSENLITSVGVGYLCYGVAEAPHRCEALRALDLDRNSLDGAAVRSLVGVAQTGALAGLQELHLEDNVFLVPLLFEALAQVRSRDVFAQLRVLGAHSFGCAMTTDDVRVVHSLLRDGMLPSLAHISLPCFGEGVAARERRLLQLEMRRRNFRQLAMQEAEAL